MGACCFAARSRGGMSCWTCDARAPARDLRRGRGQRSEFAAGLECSKRRTRIELASLPWKGKALPLSYRRAHRSAAAGGSATVTVCTNHLAVVDLAKHGVPSSASKAGRDAEVRVGQMVGSTCPSGLDAAATRTPWPACALRSDSSGEGGFRRIPETRTYVRIEAGRRSRLLALESGQPRGVAQSGSAPGWGPGGRRFKSCLPD